SRRSVRQRIDFDGTRIGRPSARRTRSAALASQASRSTAASGASMPEVAVSSRRRRSAREEVLTDESLPDRTSCRHQRPDQRDLVPRAYWLTPGGERIACVDATAPYRDAAR